MSLISIDIQCKSCEHKWDDIVEREIQEGPHLCPDCGESQGYKTLSTPMVMTASYPDGKKRFSDMKEAAKLKTLKSTSRTEERTRISQEIRKLGVKEY